MHKTDDIERLIRKARPSLLKIYPVIFWSTAVYSILNMALGLGMFLWVPTIYPLVAPNLGWLQVWAALYTGAGLAMTYGLATKRWEALRGLMCVSLFYNALWSIALLFRVSDGGTFLIASLFIGLTALQMVAIIFYLPPDGVSDEPL